MKYYLLKRICSYLKPKAQNIKFIKRLDNNIIIIEFNNKEFLYFDMQKSNSKIYKKDDSEAIKRDFNAPFDVVLQKRFINSKIEDIYLHNEDKVLCFKVNSSSSYKKLTTILQFEFTGKHTNIIILDEQRVVLEALRHVDEFASSRIVKVGHLLEEIPKQDFQFKNVEVEDIEKYLYDVYKQKEQKELENIKKQKINQVSKQINKLNKLINTLPKKEELEIQADETYKKANIILANIYKIKPYQEFLETYDYLGNEIKIKLDISKQASTFVNELFKQAKRLKQKSLNISIERNNLEEKRDFLNKMRFNLENSMCIDELEFLLPKKEKNRSKTKKQENYESFFYNGYKILLGRNERENIYLLKNSKASDFWFHLKDRTSSHVIVQNSKKSIPKEVIEKAAQLCAKFSMDFEGNYLVDYTQRRNVKIQHGSHVLYNPYTTISVKI